MLQYVVGISSRVGACCIVWRKLREGKRTREKSKSQMERRRGRLNNKQLFHFSSHLWSKMHDSCVRDCRWSADGGGKGGEVTDRTTNNWLYSSSFFLTLIRLSSCSLLVTPQPTSPVCVKPFTLPNLNSQRVYFMYIA